MSQLFIFTRILCNNPKTFMVYNGVCIYCRCPSCGWLGFCSSELARISGGQLAISGSGLGLAGVIMLCVFHPPEGVPSYVVMAMAKEQECEQGQLYSTFEASACIIFADIPVIKLVTWLDPEVPSQRGRALDAKWMDTRHGEKKSWFKKWIPLGILVCCSPWGHKELYRTEPLRNNNILLPFECLQCSHLRMWHLILSRLSWNIHRKILMLTQ